MKGYRAIVCGLALAAMAGCSDEPDPPPRRPRTRPAVRKILRPRPIKRPAPASAPAPIAAASQPTPWLRPRMHSAAESFEAFKKVSQFPALFVPHAEKAPKVDGELDAAYAKAPAPAFRHLERPGRPVVAKTVARLITAGHTLYGHFDCTAPGVEQLKADVKTRDGDVWSDEAVEIFINATGLRDGAFHHIVVNPAGVVMDARGDARGWDKGWNAAMKVATKVSPGRWRLEVAIDLAAFVEDPRWLPRAWAGNVVRLARLPDGPEDSAIWPTGSDRSFVPARFGTFYLEAGSVFEADFAKWTHPRRIHRRSARPIFRLAPAAFELIGKCGNVTPSPNKKYAVGVTTLPGNAIAAVVATEDRCVTITSLHGWRPIEARWLTDKLVYVARSESDDRGYYAVYDAERRRIVIEELILDGTDFFHRLTGK